MYVMIVIITKKIQLNNFIKEKKFLKIKVYLQNMMSENITNFLGVHTLKERRN